MSKAIPPHRRNSGNAVKFPTFDLRLVPVLSHDSHLAPVSPERLTPEALRKRFNAPLVWEPEHSVEKSFTDKVPAQAAVLIGLVMRDEVTLLLTQRADTLSTHSGQIAFPGGRTDRGDADAEDTALREATEEIGLPRRQVEVLGQLPTYTTGSAFVITPVVALVMPDVTLHPNPGEVADIFEVPLRYVMNPAHHRHHAVDIDGVHRRWLSMPYCSADGGVQQERFIWGATAGMLRNLYRFLAA